MKNFRIFLSFILSLFLAFSVVFLQGYMFLNNKLVQPDFYITSFERAGFYDYLYESIYNNFGQVSRESNLPQEIFQDIITKEWLKQQTDAAIREDIDYMLYRIDKVSAIDTEAQTDNFNKNFNSYIESQNLKLNESSQKEIENIRTKVGNIIKNQSNFLNLGNISGNSSFQHLRRVISRVYSSKLIIFSLVLANILLLFAAAGSRGMRFLYWMGYSLIAGGLFTFIPSSYGRISRFADNIAISDSGLKQLAISFIQDFLIYFNIAGAAVFAFGILIVLFSSVYEKRRG